MIRQNLPALSKVYSDALQKQADKQVPKKQPQKETLSTEAEKKATRENQGNVACDFHHHFGTVPGMEWYKSMYALVPAYVVSASVDQRGGPGVCRAV